MADVNVFVPPGLPVGPGGAATSTVSSVVPIREDLQPLFSESTAPPPVITSGPLQSGPAETAPAVEPNVSTVTSGPVQSGSAQVAAPAEPNVSTVRIGNGNVVEQIPPPQRIT